MNQSPTSKPSTSAAGGPLPAVRPRAGASGGQLRFLALSVVLFVLLGVVPVVVLLALAGALLGSLGIAELLEQSQGLAPTTYGWGFWLAVVFTVGMAVLEVRALLKGSKKEEGFFHRLLTRPSAALFLLFGPAIVLVRINAKIDVPDILTTTLLLCCLGYVYFILPLAMVGWAFRLVRWMWHVGRTSGYASGAFGVLGLALATCLPTTLCAVEDLKPPISPAQERALSKGLQDADGKGGVDGSLALLTALATADAALSPAVPTSPAGGFWSGRGDKDLFDECIERLFKGGYRSVRDKQVSLFTSQGMDRGLAEDVVQHAAIDICLHHAREPAEDLVRRFKKRSKDRRINEYRRQGVRDACAFTVKTSYYAGTPEPTLESGAVDDALCSLSEADREILRLFADDLDFKSIGQRLGMTADNARKRKERALAQLRKILKIR